MTWAIVIGVPVILSTLTLMGLKFFVFDREA